jgi:O-antigen ligase
VADLASPRGDPPLAAFATGLLALALAAVPALHERRLLLRAAIAVVAGGVVVAVYGLVARLVFADKLYGVWSVPTVAPFGPIVSKNHFAGYVELAALLSVGLAAGLASEARRGPGSLSWVESRRARWVVAAWGAAAILILAVPVCLSRGGVVSLTAGLVALAGLRFLSRRDARLSPRRLLALSVATALLLVALVSVLPTEARARVLTLAGVTTDQSGSYRLAVWRDTLRLVGSSPWLGSGFGAYQDALPRFKTAAGALAVEHAENDHLELLAEGGLVAGALAVALVAFVLARGMQGAKATTPRLAAGLVTGAIAGLVAVGVHSSFDFNLRIPSNALVCAVLVAVVLSVRTGEVAPPASRVAMLAVAVTLGAALLTPWAAPRVGPGPLLRAARSGQPSLRRAGLDADVTSHLRRHPADAAAWLALAWLRIPAAPDEASSLAAWAVRLDPTSQAVRDARARLEVHARR